MIIYSQFKAIDLLPGFKIEYGRGSNEIAIYNGNNAMSFYLSSDESPENVVKRIIIAQMERKLCVEVQEKQ